MRIPLGLVGVIALLWVGLWLSNTGVLIHSSDSRVPMTRECKYFIGVTVVSRIEPLADRCLLMRSIGP